MGIKKIVILGCGFGGLRTAIVLGRKIKRANLQSKYRVVLIDKNNYHTYTPTLYEVATTSKETANYIDLKKIVTLPVYNIINKLPVDFINKKIDALDLMGGDIHLSNGEKIRYDYAVIALGSEVNDFGIPGIQRYGLGLKNFNDALKVRDSIIACIEEKKSKKGPADNPAINLKVVVGGGGSTGVELAGEIEEWLPSFTKEAGKLDASVSIIDSGKTILSVFDERVQRLAEKRFLKLGTKLITGEFIKELTEKEVVLKSGAVLPYDIFIWTGGVKAANLIKELPLKIETQGKALVQDKMECLPATHDLKLYGKIYGLGDCICFYDPKTKKPVPGVARAAILQGSIVAKNIFEEIKIKEGISKKAKIFTYRPMEYPYILPVGGKWAIAKIGPLVISGFGGWILKGLVELNYLLSIMPISVALKMWLKGLKIFTQNDRLG